MNTKPKAEFREMKDGRIILGARLYHKMRMALCREANGKCEICGVWTGLQGEAHHIFGRGGGKRDDRIYVDGNRNLQWLCPACHTGNDSKHNPKAVPKKALPTDEELREMLGL